MWQGVLGAYASHSCPQNVDDITDIARLQELFNFDERMYIKLDVLRKIGRELVGSGEQVGHMQYLGMICTYMRRYIGYLEICTVCVDILERLIQSITGRTAMVGIGKELTSPLEEMTAYESLRDRAMALLEKLTKFADAGGALVLRSLKKTGNVF